MKLPDMPCGTMQMFINIHSGANIVQKYIIISQQNKNCAKQNDHNEFEYPDSTFI